MSFVSRQFAFPAARVFDALSDPRTYPRWLVGASRIRSVDDAWPAVGSRFHHRVGIAPLTIADSTELRVIDPPQHLQLAVRARPLISAVVTFDVVGDDHDRCVVTMEEEPAVHVVGSLVRPVMDPLTHVRNHLSLRRLQGVLEERAEQPVAGG